MPTTVHVDVPADFVIDALPTHFGGWVASDAPIDSLIFRVNETPVEHSLVERPDVSRAFRDMHVAGWDFWINPLTWRGPRKNALLEIAVNGHVEHRSDLHLSRVLAPEVPKLYWMHIPKTAGTSVFEAMQGQIRPSRILRVYEDPSGVLVDGLSEVPQSYRDGLEVIFGHFVFGAHRQIGDAPYYATVLREPAELLISYIAFVKGVVPGDTFLDNPQTRYLSGVGSSKAKGTMNETDLQLAKENASKYFAHIGFTDLLNASAEWLRREFGPNVRDPKHTNVTPAAKPSRLPPDADIRLDLELYAWCRANMRAGKAG